MMNASESRAWLQAAAAPGHRAFRLAAFWSGVGTIAMLGQVAAVAIFLGPTVDRAHGSLWWSAALGTVAFVGRLVAMRTAAVLASTGAQQVVGNIRRRLLGQVFGPQSRTTDVAATADTVVDQTERLSGYYERYEPLRLSVRIDCAIIACAVLSVNWVVAAMLVIATPFVPINMAVVGMGAEAASRKQLEQVQALSSTVLDRIRALPMLVGIDAVDTEAERVTSAGTELRVRTMKVLRLALVSASVLDLVSTFAIAVVATYVGLALLGFLHTSLVPSHISLSHSMFLLLLTPAYFQPLRAFAASYHDRANATAAADVIDAALVAAARPAFPESPENQSAPPAVHLSNVSVHYPGRAEPALHHVTLQVPAGRIVALVGASGAGKSTLLALAAGLLAPTAGRVEHVDGTGASRPADPGTLGWCSQRPVLFSGSVSDNITVGDKVQPRAALAAAIDGAGLRNVVDRRVGGANSLLSEEGRDLSGGERQRIGLARVLYKNAQLVILDEPTAHLDLATEAAMIEVLRRVLAGRTALIATHSSAVLTLADEVITLVDGTMQGESTDDGTDDGTEDATDVATRVATQDATDVADDDSSAPADGSEVPIPLGGLLEVSRR